VLLLPPKAGAVFVVGGFSALAELPNGFVAVGCPKVDAPPDTAGAGQISFTLGAEMLR